MPSKYYAHFVTDASEPQLAGEYSGVVELEAPLRPQRETHELRCWRATSISLPRISGS
jgi:hypothetical protein